MTSVHANLPKRKPLFSQITFLSFLCLLKVTWMLHIVVGPMFWGEVRRLIFFFCFHLGENKTLDIMIQTSMLP